MRTMRDLPDFFPHLLAIYSQRRLAIRTLPRSSIRLGFHQSDSLRPGLWPSGSTRPPSREGRRDSPSLLRFAPGESRPCGDDPWRPKKVSACSGWYPRYDCLTGGAMHQDHRWRLARGTDDTALTPSPDRVQKTRHEVEQIKNEFYPARSGIFWFTHLMALKADSLLQSVLLRQLWFVPPCDTHKK